MKKSKKQVKQSTTQERAPRLNSKRKKEIDTATECTSTNGLLLHHLPTPIYPIANMPTLNPNNINHPVDNGAWRSLLPPVPAPTSIYGIQPVPVVVEPQPTFTHVIAYTCPVESNYPQSSITPTIYPEIPTQQIYNCDEQSTSYTEEERIVLSNVMNYKQDEHGCGEPVESIFNDVISFIETSIKKEEGLVQDPLDTYLSLPKDLFPTARMLRIDPNPVIDEFCKVKNINKHVLWLLDLELGIPKQPITRPLPVYNVKFNSINCKNTPDAIHPGFESCSPEFKRILLFYYDSVISSWYRGYTEMNYDNSIENFQAWLQLPMQVLGMCWP